MPRFGTKGRKNDQSINNHIQSIPKTREKFNSTKVQFMLRSIFQQ